MAGDTIENDTASIDTFEQREKFQRMATKMIGKQAAGSSQGTELMQDSLVQSSS